MRRASTLQNGVVTTPLEPANRAREPRVALHCAEDAWLFCHGRGLSFLVHAPIVWTRSIAVLAEVSAHVALVLIVVVFAVRFADRLA